MVYSMGKSVGNPIHMREKEEREKEKKENKVNKKVKPLGVTGRRHSADQLLSIANDNEEWKRFYVSKFTLISCCFLICSFIVIKIRLFY